MNVYRSRLLNVARAVREGKHPKRFTMKSWGGFCGTPHCALGHYAARKDLQKTFSIQFTLSFSRPATLLANGDFVGSINSDKITQHFGISKREAIDLFSKNGCGDAQNPEEAACYIEEFVERKWPSPKAHSTHELNTEVAELVKLKKELEKI